MQLSLFDHQHKRKANKWSVLDHCPDWFVIKCIGPGDNPMQVMLNAVAELFAKSDQGTPTHVHFYAESLEAARKLYSEIRHLIPRTIHTMSFGK